MKTRTINGILFGITIGIQASAASAQQGQWAYGNDNTNDRGHRISRMAGGDLISVNNETITRHATTTTTIDWDVSFPDFYPMDVIESNDGRIVAVGPVFGSNGTGDTTLVFLNSSGILIGTHHYPGRHVYEHCDLIQTSDDGFLIALEDVDPASSGRQPFLIKTDVNGVEDWMHRYDVVSDAQDQGEFSFVIEGEDANGNPLYHMTGFYDRDFGTSWETLMMTVDGAGNTVNSVALGFDNHSDFGRGLTAYEDGFLVTGYSKQLGEGGGTYLMRLTSDFQVMWYYGIPGFSGTKEIQITSDNTAILAGSTGIGYPIRNAAMIEVDLNGTPFATGMQYGGINTDAGADFTVDDSGYALIGQTYSFGSPGNDRYLVRVDGTLMSGCNESPFQPEFIAQEIDRKVLEMNPIEILPIGQYPMQAQFSEYFEKALCTVPEPCECFPPPPEMNAWWTMDEPSGITVSESIAGMNGTRLGNPTTITGMVGNALDFDGFNDWVEVPGNPMLDVGFGAGMDGDFSLDAWIRIDSPGVMEWGPIATNSGTCSGYAFYVRNDRLELACSDGPLQARHVSTNAIPHGQWVHVGVVAQRPGYPRFYIDGVEELAPTSGMITLGNLGNTQSPFLIGRLEQFCAAENVATRFFDGAIEEVEFFNRALNASEIQGIHDAMACGKCKISCDPPWDQPFCADDSSIQVVIPVCNASATTVNVQLSFAGLAPPTCGSIAGPTGFTVLAPGNPISIPGNQCQNVIVKIDRPTGMNTLNQVGCYEMTVENLSDGTTSTCRGSVQDRRDLCPLVPDHPLEIAIGVAQLISIPFENTGFEESMVEWRAVAYGPDMTPSQLIALDGGEPGTFTGGEIPTKIGARGQIDLTIEALAFQSELSDLVIFTRSGNTFVPLTSLAVRTVFESSCPGDYDGDGQINGADLSSLLGAWNAKNSPYDLTGDGVVNGQDLAFLLGRWGACLN
jgi:hypothetical protein